MQNLPFTLRQLEVFATLCGSLSFRGSAERLGISQASISNQMRQLEDQLGFALFRRRPGKRPSLTEDGAAFLADYAGFAEAAQRLAAHRRQTPQHDRPIAYRVRIGEAMMDYYIRRKLDGFHAQNPLIDLGFEVAPPANRDQRDIADGPYDFALFHRRAYLPADPRLRVLAELRGGVWGHHRFAEGHALPLTATEASELPFILPRAGSRQESDTLEALARVGVVPRQIVCHSQYFDVMAAMLERGFGVASFLEAIIPPDLRGHLVELMPTIRWHLVWYRADPRPDPHRDAVERFLIASLLDDPLYSATRRVDRDYRVEPAPS